MIGSDWFLIEGTGPAGTEYYLAFAHPTKLNKVRKTSPIVSCIKGVVTTLSGSTYGLGKASSLVRNHFKSIGLEYNELDPIPESLWIPADTPL